MNFAIETTYNYAKIHIILQIHDKHVLLTKDKYLFTQIIIFN